MRTISQLSCAAIEEDHEAHELDEPSENLVDDEALGADGDDDLDLGIEESSGLADDDLGSNDKLDIGGMDVQDESAARSELDDAPLDNAMFDEGGAPTFADEGDASDELGPSDVAGDALGDEGLPATADDGGAEGLSDGSETFIDEALLPAMDAGAEGDFELNDLLSEMGFGGDDAWEIAPGFGSDVSLASVRAQNGTVAAVGAAAVLIGAGEHTPRVRAIEEPAHDCAVSGDRVFLATSRGIEVLGPGDAGALLVAMADVSALAIAAEQLFVLVEHALSRVDVATGKSELLRSDVISVGAAEGTLFVADLQNQIDRRRGHDGDFERCASETSAAGAMRIMACASKTLLLCDDEKAFRFDDRDQRRVLDAEGVVAGAAFAAEELLLLSLEPGAFVVSLVDKSGDVRRIARVRHSAEPPVALAWDASRELIFVAGPAGLLALRRRLSH